MIASQTTNERVIHSSLVHSGRPSAHACCSGDLRLRLVGLSEGLRERFLPACRAILPRAVPAAAGTCTGTEPSSAERDLV